MPISDYANAFFFARRNRVTLWVLERDHAIAVAFSKTSAINSRHQHRRGYHGLHKPAFLHKAVFDRQKMARKNSAHEIGRAIWRHAAQRKKPATRRARTYFSIYFISRAWRFDAPSRETFGRHCLVNDVALRCLHQFRFRAHHRLQCCIAVTALDRFFDCANRAAHLGATRLVDDGAAGDLARRLLGRGGVGHASNILRQ